MADFCMRCSIDLFGEDLGELARLTTPEETQRCIYAHALCEECGPIYVDHTGKRIEPLSRDSASLFQVVEQAE